MTKKRILCLFLAILLLFPCYVSAATDTAATEEEKVTMIVASHKTLESGRTFYLGDMVDVRLDTDRFPFMTISGMGSSLYLWTATEIGATYVSDHPEVLTVQEKSGYAETKEPGTANVTLS